MTEEITHYLKKLNMKSALFAGLTSKEIITLFDT
jgi:hypothetical protein